VLSYERKPTPVAVVLFSFSSPNNLYISLLPSNRSCLRFSSSLWLTFCSCSIPYLSAHTPRERATPLSTAHRTPSARHAVSNHCRRSAYSVPSVFLSLARLPLRCSLPSVASGTHLAPATHVTCTPLGGGAHYSSRRLLFHGCASQPLVSSGHHPLFTLVPCPVDPTACRLHAAVPVLSNWLCHANGHPLATVSVLSTPLRPTAHRCNYPVDAATQHMAGSHSCYWPGSWSSSYLIPHPVLLTVLCPALILVLCLLPISVLGPVLVLVPSPVLLVLGCLPFCGCARRTLSRPRSRITVCTVHPPVPGSLLRAQFMSCP
jgi:hypothetical protein